MSPEAVDMNVSASSAGLVLIHLPGDWDLTSKRSLALPIITGEL